MKWEKVKLDKLGNISRGRSKHRPRNDTKLFGGDYPFIQTADVKKANFYIKEYSETYNELGLEQSKLWDVGTLCITIAANIADTGILGIPACFPDSIMGFIPYDKISDVRFVKYSFDLLQRDCKQISQGTAQDNLSWEKLSMIEFPCPPIETQRQIADILSAYDDLIENNQKQIKLLEEAAQRLYKEWFVDLRFPGYEQTKIIDGVPEGWEIVCLKAYCDIKSGYAFKSKDWNKSGCGVIKIKDISNKFVDYSDCDFVPKDIAEKATNYYLNQGDLVIAMTGATIGKIGICTKEGYYANQRVGKVFLGNKPKEKLPYAYCILSQKSTMDFILNNSSASSAQPNISGDKICDIKIVYNEVYVMRFNKKMKSVFEKMILLKEQNEMLSVIRDNLLPKLMSGEIEV